MYKLIHLFPLLILAPFLGYSQTNVAASSNGAKAIASSTYSAPPIVYDPMEAIDELIPSAYGWLSASPTMPEWLEVTFDKSYTIDSILLNFSPNNINQTYDLEYWDGGSWKLLTAASPSAVLNATFKFAPVNTNKVRFYCTIGKSNGYAFVEEIMVFERSPNTSTDQLQALKKILLYPNPNNGAVNINTGNLTGVTIKAFSQLGQMTYLEEGVSGIHQFELNGASGLYVIEVSSQGKTQRFKIMKN